MTLNNSERIVVFRLANFVATLVYVMYVFFAYFPKAFSKIIPGEYLNLVTLCMTVIYLIILSWPVVMQYQYIFFSGDERGITLRWYKTGIMPGESKSIEIPADRFAGYVITKKHLGLHYYLTLYQNNGNQRAEYNPVCINALTREQKQKLVSALDSYKSTT